MPKFSVRLLGDEWSLFSFEGQSLNIKLADIGVHNMHQYMEKAGVEKPVAVLPAGSGQYRCILTKKDAYALADHLSFLGAREE